MLNNFHWTRRWTFARHEGSARTQMPRFVLVSLSAFLIATVLLALLVDLLDVSAVIARAVAIATVTPLSFIANRCWSFRPLPEGSRRDGEPA